MFYRKNRIAFACFCLSIVMVSACIKKLEFKVNEKKNMKSFNQTNNKNGSFLAHDTLGNAIILKWEEIAGKTEKLSEKIRSLSDVLVPAYTQSEVDFARKKPVDVPTDFMLKTLAPLLEQGINNVDWKIFEAKTKTVLEQFFATLDWAGYAGDHDTNIFVVAVDQKTAKNVGVIQFLITPEFAAVHTVKAALYGVIPSAQDRGLEQLLISSIFKLRPDVKRLITDTRSTNQRFISMHEKWGFTQFKGEVPGFTDVEYIVEKVNTLQKIAETIVCRN